MRHKFIFLSSFFATFLLADAAPQKMYPQGHSAKRTQMMDSYNQPARIDVEGQWDFFVTGSFLYWEAREEGLFVTLSNPTQSGVADIPNQGGQLLEMDFEFKPGFKVGLGYHSHYDQWDVFAEYTRFHQKTSFSTSAPNPPFGSLRALWLNFTQPNLIADSASASWNMDFDRLDIEVARSYYVGLGLTFRPQFGGRALWLDQQFDVRYQLIVGAEAPSTTKTDSWALGPVFALDANWLLGWGFRMITNSSFSLLYTRYKFSHSEPAVSTNQVFNLREENSYLRPMMELAMGFGWGTYFWNDRLRIDFSATYEFNTYWHQNMMAHYQNLSGGNNPSAGLADLYIHGLTISGRLDF